MSSRCETPPVVVVVVVAAGAILGRGELCGQRPEPRGFVWKDANGSKNVTKLRMKAQGGGLCRVALDAGREGYRVMSGWDWRTAGWELVEDGP